MVISSFPWPPINLRPVAILSWSLSPCIASPVLRWYFNSTWLFPLLDAGPSAPYPGFFSDFSLSGFENPLSLCLATRVVSTFSPLGNQNLCNFDTNHDLTKASINSNHMHQPQRIVTKNTSCSSCNSKQEATLFSTPTFFKILSLPLPYIHRWSKGMKNYSS